MSITSPPSPSVSTPTSSPPRTRRPKSTPVPKTKVRLAKPRWQNANYLLFLVLKQHPQRQLPRTELMRAAVALDGKISEEMNLPRVFTGKTPENSASAALTVNSDKLFVAFKPEGSRSTWFRLAFEPADFKSAVEHYNAWIVKLITDDWPECFGKRIWLEDNEKTMAIPGLVDCLARRQADEERIKVEAKQAEEEKRRKEREELLRYRKETAPETTPRTYETRKRKLSDRDSNAADSLPKRLTSLYGDNTAFVDELIAAESDNAVTEVPRKRLQKFISPFPENLDLTKIPNATVMRFSPTIVEIYLPESSPPKHWKEILEVRPSTIPNAGNGLFAIRQLPSSAPIGFYFGIPLTEDEYDSSKDGVGHASHYSIMYRRTVLDATDENGNPFTDEDGPLYCPFHFMNEDVVRGNVSFKEGSIVNQVIVFTNREILPGEELFVDYGKEVERHWKVSSPSSNEDASKQSESKTPSRATTPDKKVKRLKSKVEMTPPDPISPSTENEATKKSMLDLPCTLQ